MKDHYAALGVPRTASMEEIRSSYHEQVMHQHPDRNPDVHDTSRFRELQEAYEVIGDPCRRRAYDEEIRGSERDSTEQRTAAAGVRPSEAPLWGDRARQPPVWPSYEAGWSPQSLRESAPFGEWEGDRAYELDELLWSEYRQFDPYIDLDRIARRLRARVIGREWFDW